MGYGFLNVKDIDMATLRDTVDEIEKEYLRDNVYVFCEKLDFKYKVESAVNDIIDGLNGCIYDLYQDHFIGQRFYEMLSESNKKKYMLDNEANERAINTGLSYFGQVKSYLSIEKKGRIDFLLITSPYKYRNNLLKIALSKKRRSPKRLILAPFVCMYHHARKIDLITELKNRGIDLTPDMLEGMSVTYKDMHDDYQKYKEAIGTGEKEIECIRRLFGDFFSARDFMNARKWSDLLVEKVKSSKERKTIQKIWGKLDEAFDNARKTIKDNKHILITWVDGLRFDELEEMPYLNQKMHGGLFFESMYTEIPYTSATTKGILTGKHYIEGRHFDFSYGDFERSILIKLLNYNGYKIVSNSECLFREWIKDYDIEKVLTTKPGYREPMTVMQYLAVCRMEEERKTISFVHDVYGIHEPRWSPDYPKQINGLELPPKSKKLCEQLRNTKLYIDEQLQWWDGFFDNTDYHIYMSDHGQPRWETTFTVEGMHHVVFSVLGKNIVASSINQVTTIIDFWRILSNLISDKTDSLANVGRDYVIIENDDPYGKRVKEIIWRNNHNKPIVTDQWLQYRGVVTEEDSYVRIATGKEYYYRKNEENNCVDDPKHKKRIEELRVICGNRWIDIEAEKKYRGSLELYKKLKLNVNWR